MEPDVNNTVILEKTDILRTISGYLRDRFPALADVDATTPLLQSGAIDSLGAGERYERTIPTDLIARALVGRQRIARQRRRDAAEREMRRGRATGGSSPRGHQCPNHPKQS